MRLYFAADNHAPETLQKQFSAIVDILNKAGVTVMSNLVHKNIAGFSNQDLEKMEQTGETMIEQMDAIIIEATRPIPEAGYLVAVGLTHKKPVLYLTQSGKSTNKNLLHIKKDPTAAKLLHLDSYNDKNLEKTLVDFLGQIEQGEGGEMPSIKFTLRITKRIERYLSWKTNNTARSKADYLRDMIEEMIKRDNDYQKFIADRKIK